MSAPPRWFKLAEACTRCGAREKIAFAFEYVDGDIEQLCAKCHRNHRELLAEHERIRARHEKAGALLCQRKGEP